MKKLLILTVLFVGQLLFAQMPNISKVWLNNNKPYVGEIGDKKTTLLLHITFSEQDKKNDQEYFLSGNVLTGKKLANVEGKLKITKYKDGKKNSTVFGEYELLQDPSAGYTGKLTGKFIYTFKWNHKTEKIENQYIEMVGDWNSYDGKVQHKTRLKSQ